MEESNYGINSYQSPEDGLGCQSETNEEITNNNRKASVGFLENELAERRLSENQDTLSRNLLENNPTSNFDEREPDSNPVLAENLTAFDTSTFGTIENDKYKYIGQIKDEMREGFGICYYKNGTIFKGTYKSDRREGWGIEIYQNGDSLQGETVDDCFNGYCELRNKYSTNKFTLTCGYYRGHRFVDIITLSDEYRNYEGEIIHDSNSRISIGKLIRLNKNCKKIFMGEIQSYKDECGYGIFLIFNKVTSMYLCQIRNKQYEHYYEMFNSDGISNFGIISKGIKQGLCFSFSKDGKVAFGKFEDNYKNGPFITFSNSQNLPKSSVRLEMYHYDFRSKCVDKMDTLKKYILTNYPEYKGILDVNYTEIIGKMNLVINEEMSYLQTFTTEKS